MRDTLIAYLLDDLSPEERERIEDRLANDPIWQNELERLRECIKDYAADPQANCPPSDLVNRTCKFVRHTADTCDSPATLSESQKGLSESHEGLVGKKRWSIFDLVVAATVLVAVAALLFPSLRSSRDVARQQDCQNNLYQLGLALVEYNDKFGQGTPHVKPGENAGIFVVKLADSGIISRERLAELLLCPSSPQAKEVFAGRVRMQVPTQIQLNSMSADLLARVRQQMAGSYAYRLGFLDQSGNYQQVRFVRLSTAPMLADTPSFSVAGFQSANHGSSGQNFLFQDLSSRHIRLNLTANEKGLDHPFLNEDHQHAAGLTPLDVVLGRSEVGLSGPLVRVVNQ